MRGIKLRGYKELTKDTIINYEPRSVYIPLLCPEDLDLKIRRGSNIKIGTVLGINKKNNIPILSSVSGRVIDYFDKYCYTGEIVRTIEVQNDGLHTFEQPKDLKEINKYTKKEFIEILRRSAIKGMGGADFPTYIKYDTKKRIKHLIINAVECEPYITADYVILKEHTKEILDSIDAIMTINKIEFGYIVVKKNNDLISKIKDLLCSYPKIKMVKVPNLYPMGWERNVVTAAIKKSYDKLPIEVDAVVNNVSTVYAIYNALKDGIPLISRIITVSGDGIKKPINVRVRIGQNAHDLLEGLGYKRKKNILISGGPMMGRSMPSDDFIITSNVNSILLFKPEDEEIQSVCFRCGKCASVCPAKLSPVLIKDNINNVEELKKLNVSKCIECGLCSYICPAKILLRNKMIQAKKNVRDAK